MYAEKCGFDKRIISKISIKHAEHLYSIGDFQKSIDEYIKTINFYEPSNVIQKFLEKSKLDYLIKYLESIVHNIDFRIRDASEHKNYTSLLLNCYIMQEDYQKLKEFIDKRGKNFSKDSIKTVIKVYLEADKVDVALSIAKQNQLIEDYLSILIIRQNKHEEAINILAESEKNEWQITNQDKINLYYKFGEYFLKTEEGKENFSDKFFNSVLKFIENNVTVLDKSDISKLIQIFVDSDKYFKIFFEKMDSYHLDYEQDMVHRRIELYLEEGEQNKSKIIEMIKDNRFVGKYDSQYIIMLFKNNKFIEGIEALSEFLKISQELLMMNMEKNNYSQIIQICKTYGSTNVSYWWDSLDYFLNKEYRSKLNENQILEINKYLDEFLQGLLDSGIALSVDILNIIYEKNNDIPLDIINNFIFKSIDHETNLIEEGKKNFKGYDSLLDKVNNEIKDLRTKSYMVNIIRCSECTMPINVPYVVFKCGHGYHNLCIQKNKMECKRCRDKIKKNKEEIESNDIFKKKVNSLEKLEKEIRNNKNKMDFIDKLYGIISPNVQH